jgi:hypothetical protein
VESAGGEAGDKASNTMQSKGFTMGSAMAVSGARKMLFGGKLM